MTDLINMLNLYLGILVSCYRFSNQMCSLDLIMLV